MESLSGQKEWGSLMQTDYVLFRNPQDPIKGTSDGSGFLFPGTCLTANTFKLHIAQFVPGCRVKMARWVVSWNPQVFVAGPTSALRLVMFDDGPANVQQVARIGTTAGQVYQTPRVDAVDITDWINAAILTGVTKQFGHQTAGVGANGSLLYSSTIEVVWEV